MPELRISRIVVSSAVSSSWNQFGIHALRKIHPVIQFSAYKYMRVNEFLSAMPIGPLPFSGFSFNQMDPKVVLDFLDIHGSSARELQIHTPDYEFGFPLSTSVIEAFVNALQKISNVVFSQTPMLASLELTVFEATLPMWDDIPFARYPHLKKLVLLVTKYVGHTEMEFFIEELVRRSPALYEFAIGNGTLGFSNYQANSNFFANLPHWLKRIPRSMRVGLRFYEVNDSVLPLLNSLMSEPINLVNLSIESAKFEDSTVSDLFPKWLFQQPLEKIEMGNGINWEHQNGKNIFKECKKLTLNHRYDYQEASYGMMLLCFPNVTHFKLYNLEEGSLVLLETMMSSLEHLSWNWCPDLWEIFTGISTKNVLKSFVGVEVVPPGRKESPLRNLTALKSLELWIRCLDDLLPILYCTKQGTIPRLKRLSVRLDYIRDEDTDTKVWTGPFSLPRLGSAQVEHESSLQFSD